MILTRLTALTENRILLRTMESAIQLSCLNNRFFHYGGREIQRRLEGPLIRHIEPFQRRSGGRLLALQDF